jgi:hypothetical protein
MFTKPTIMDKKMIGLDIGIKEAAKVYNMSFFNSTMKLIEDVKSYNKIGGLKKEVSMLSQQIFVLNGICANHNKAMMAMINLQSRGITEDRILQLNKLLENDGYKTGGYTSTSKHAAPES